MQMTQITQVLGEIGALRSMARELGVTEKEVRSGAEVLVPAILAGFRKRTQSQLLGLDTLGELIVQLGGGDLLDNVLAPRPTDVSRGNELLRHVFGSKDASRAAAQNAASQSGIAPYLLRQMLPMLAMLLAGYIARGEPGSVPPQESTARSSADNASSLRQGRR